MNLIIFNPELPQLTGPAVFKLYKLKHKLLCGSRI